jgi:predicted transcriptional regulator
MKPGRSILHDADVDAEAAADAQGLADLDAGSVVSGDAVKRWLGSWGTADRLLTPCIGD